MSTYKVEVTRKVTLIVVASSDGEAREKALNDTWDWLPENAAGLDQGSASAIVLQQVPG